MNEKNKEIPFEALLERLESIVNQMEKGELSLENSLKAYEKGVGVIREAEQRLEKMEGKIEELMADGKKKPFAVDQESGVVPAPQAAEA